jgi:hypothetical protein
VQSLSPPNPPSPCTQGGELSLTLMILQQQLITAPMAHLWLLASCSARQCRSKACCLAACNRSTSSGLGGSTPMLLVPAATIPVQLLVSDSALRSNIWNRASCTTGNGTSINQHMHNKLAVIICCAVWHIAVCRHPFRLSVLSGACDVPHPAAASAGRGPP